MQKYPVINRSVLTVCYLVIQVFSSCETKTNKKVDVSKIDIAFKAINHHQELFAIDTNNIEKGIEDLGNKYPEFSSVFFNELTGFAAKRDPQIFHNSVRHFLTYKDYRNLYDTVMKQFPDTKKLDKQLQDLFKHIKYYFPEEHWGTVYYFISGLNQWSAVTVDTLLGVGLDMYLGSNYPFYPSVQMPEYQILHCEPDYVAVDAAKTIFENKFPLQADDKNLLDLMILKGLQMTFVEYTLPERPDDILMGYTPAQLQWCKNNEGMIWSYLKKQDLLYSIEWQKILRYVKDGPSSTGMPQESPGNIGTWIGWQMVRHYLKEHPDVKWNELVKQKINGQEFLRDSKYKPR